MTISQWAFGDQVGIYSYGYEGEMAIKSYIDLKIKPCCNWSQNNSRVTGLILGLHPANERRRYFVTTSLIGWVQA